MSESSDIRNASLKVFSSAWKISRRDALAGASLVLAASSVRAQTPPVAIRVGYVPVIGASALFVLEGAGWAKAAGLNLQMTRFDSGPAAIQALASGSLDLLAIGLAPVAVAFSKGLDVRIVSAAGLGGSAFLAGKPLADALASAPNRAAAFANLREKLGRPVKLASLPPGSVPTIALRYWLFKTGSVATSDVEIAPLGIDGVQQAMLSHAVDGAAALEPSATLISARDPDVSTIATAASMFPDIPGVVIAGAGAFAKTHPEALKSFVALTIRATDLIKAAPEKAAPYVAATLGGGLIDPAIMLRALRSPAVGFETDPSAIAEAAGHMLAYEAEIGDFRTAPAIAGLIDASWWKQASSAGK